MVCEKTCCSSVLNLTVCVLYHPLLMGRLNACVCVCVCVCVQDIYSKRIIPTVSITGVVNVGEQKFEVVTHNRTFLFRAESDCECTDCVCVCVV